MIRTIIVDDEVLAGVGIQSLIDGQEDISVSGVFSLPEEAIEFLKENVRSEERRVGKECL